MTVMTGAQAVVEELRQERVRYVFALPGTTILDILDSAYGMSDITFIVVRHEQEASFMADGYARASGRIGVCMASRGPGATNMATGVHNAYEESSPVVAIIGQVGTDILHRQAFEEMALVEFFQPMTKWAVEIDRADRIPELLGRALRVSVAGRPRPVMVSIPADVQAEQAEMHSAQGPPQAPPQPEAMAIEQAICLLLQSRRPVVLVGGGVRMSGATSELVHLAESLSLPVVTAWYRNDCFPNDHPLYLGSLGPWATEASVQIVAQADLVLVVGCRLGEFTTQRYSLFSQEARIIQVDIDPLEIARVFPVDLPIVTDARAALSAISQALQGSGSARPQPLGGPTWFEELHRQFVQAFVPDWGKQASQGISPAQVVVALNESLGRDGILVLDSGNFASWFCRYYRFNSPGSLVGPAGGSMGFGLPAALGVKLAQPQMEVVAVAGDGGFMMTIQALATAVSYDIPILTIVMNNSAYGNVLEKQRRLYQGRIFGSKLSNLDFGQIATDFGAHGERVTRSDQLGPALRRGLTAGRPAVLDVVIDQADLSPPARRGQIPQCVTTNAR